MRKIYQLPPHEAQKIAAGEVVERPANVLKELIENSLDAGTTQLIMYIEDGGKKLIRIVDNGCGMSPEDAKLSIAHHATSKIKSINDLDTLQSFGFRGEALSSISAVSNFTLITKEAESLEGTKFTIHDGEIHNLETVSCNTGTEIVVEDIFYNVPARKKFLKTRETEWRAIQNLVTAFCLDYPSVSFALYHENKVIINCPPAADLKTRISQVFSSSLAHSMQICESHEKSIGLKLYGAVSLPQHNRYDRNQLYFFTNKRWVKNHKLAQALMRGYQNSLPPQMYPTAIIFLELDPTLVDINVHPRKEEVLFLHPRKVEIALELMVKECLENHVNFQLNKKYPPVSNPFTTPAVRSPLILSEVEGLSGASKNFTNNSINFGNLEKLPETLSNQASSAEFTKILEKSFVREFPETDLKSYSFVSLVQKEEPANKIDQEKLELTEDHAQATLQEHTYTIIGQLHKTYILVETPDGLLLIDQHAAHERILYELFANRFHEVATIALLFPQVITLNQEDCLLIEQYKEIFTTNGILLEIMGQDSCIITAVPVHLKDQAIQEFIRLVLTTIHESQHADTTTLFKIIHEKLRAQMACKAAVKAGDILSHEHMQELIVTLLKTENRLTCPHGRPTSWPISLFEIEKKFKRKV